MGPYTHISISVVVPLRVCLSFFFVKKKKTFTLSYLRVACVDFDGWWWLSRAIRSIRSHRIRKKNGRRKEALDLPYYYSRSLFSPVKSTRYYTTLLLDGETREPMVVSFRRQSELARPTNITKLRKQRKDTTAKNKKKKNLRRFPFFSHQYVSVSIP